MGEARTKRVLNWGSCGVKITAFSQGKYYMERGHPKPDQTIEVLEGSERFQKNEETRNE